VKHGLLAKSLVFQTEEEKKLYNDLVADFREDRQPVGCVEVAAVEEMAINHWRLAQTYPLMISEQQNRRRVGTAVLNAASQNSHDEQAGFLREINGSISGAQHGWDCHEFVVRNVTRNSEEENATIIGSKTLNVGALQIEAKLTTSLDAVLRYQASLKRDFYRALRTLMELQEARWSYEAMEGGRK
jgi:hypothetical protein